MEKTRISRVLNSLISIRLFQHLSFWGAAYAILINVFKISDDLGLVDFIYTGIFMSTLMIAVYINLVLLIPYILVRRKYLFYSMAIVSLLLLAVLFNELVFNKLIDSVLPGFYFISYYSLIDLGVFFSAFLALSSLFKLSKEWFQLVDTKQRLNEVEKEKAEIELKALRAQVNPHFLFNSLNVLYSLALKKSKESPDAIIRLSDILRYVIYESSKDLVKLSSEVRLIEDYLTLQRYRIDNTSNIDFSLNLDQDNTIAPMLLLPLVENSFKHGIKGDLNNTYVNIDLVSKNNMTIFIIENNSGDSIDPEGKKNKGIGLKNIKSRLELIYPARHTLEIISSEQSFKVTLEIQHEN